MMDWVIDVVTTTILNFIVVITTETRIDNICDNAYSGSPHV